jgi:hypothetical protein
MNTISANGRFRCSAAEVIGARHLRGARNGQDAAAMWAGEDAAAIVVCDGCSAGASSEVGARLGASLIARLVGERLAAGARPSCDDLWSGVRADATRALASVAAQLAGEVARVIADYFLFTIIAAAATRDDAAVWVLGDGAFAFDRELRVLGPFEDNQPPYLGYDLLGDPRAAQLSCAPADWRAIAIATDGAAELGDGLARFTSPRFVGHPDALRRELAVRARSDERIDWDERRVVRVPAQLQDDCAIAVLCREVA